MTEFANEPEINCVFCGLGFTSVENVETHIQSNHQSNNVDNIEMRKLLTVDERSCNDSTQHSGNKENNEKHNLNNGFKSGNFKCNIKPLKPQPSKYSNIFNQRKCIGNDKPGVSNQGISKDLHNGFTLTRRNISSTFKHKCSKCFKHFLFHSTLLIHFRNHQYENKSKYRCENCGFKYSTKHILHRHLAKCCALSSLDLKSERQKQSEINYCKSSETAFTCGTYLERPQRNISPLLREYPLIHTTKHISTSNSRNHIRSQRPIKKYHKNSSDVIILKDSKTHSSEPFSIQRSQDNENEKYHFNSTAPFIRDGVSPITPNLNNPKKVEIVEDKAQDCHWHNYNCKSLQKPFQCEICNKLLSNRSSLSNHIKSHYSSRGQPFICRDCNQRFVNLITLQDHRRQICSQKVIETKSPGEEEIKFREKPIYSLSNFNGVSQVPLWPNINQNPTVNQPVTCVHCNGIFYDRLELEEHALTKHSDEHGNILCLLCERTFTTNMALRVHLTKSHGFANGGCPGVSQNLPPMPRLDTNYNISNEIPHKKRRRRMFEYDKEYSCEFCHRNFSTGQALGNHRRACMNMPSDLVPMDDSSNNHSQSSKLHSIESLIFDNKTIRSTSFKDDKNVFLAFN